MGYGEQLIVEFEDGEKVEKEESRFTLEYLVQITSFLGVAVKYRFSFVHVEFGFLTGYSGGNVV